MTDINFSIQVVTENGHSVHGARVEVYFGGMLYSGTSLETLTSANGWAEFISPTGVVSAVYIDGERVSDGFHADDGDTFSFTHP